MLGSGRTFAVLACVSSIFGPAHGKDRGRSSGPEVREWKVAGRMLRAVAALVLLSPSAAARAAPVDVRGPSSPTTKVANECWTRAADVGGLDAFGLGKCLIAGLAFEPGRYFSAGYEATNYDPAQPGDPIVDAVFSNSYPQWAFAVDLDCPYKGQVGAPPKCSLMLRVASWKSPTPRASYSEFLEGLGGEVRPASPPVAEVRRYLDASVDWREADLRACPGAVHALLAIEAVQWFSFDQLVREQAATGKPLEAETVYEGPVPYLNRITVRAYDGKRVLPGGGTLTSASALADAGGTSHWAKTMLKIVEPCLKPASVPAPWDRD
jgi:hypothetical protein